MKNQNILHITGMISTKYGGIERYLLYANEYCKSLGLKTHLQYETPPRSHAYLHDLNRADANLVISPVNIAGMASGIKNLKKMLARIKPDIVHAHFVEPYARLAIPLLARVYAAKRVLCTVHNKPDWNSRRIGAVAYNFYDYILTVSDSVKESLMNGGVQKNKLHTHYLGIIGGLSANYGVKNRIRTKYNIPREATVLVTIAFDAPFKGIDILLEALSKVNHNIHWLSVGVDRDKSKLPTVAERLKIENRVHWVGIIDDGWSILNAADIYVQPSRSSEGLPLAIMEAMAMGIPVICTKVSGNVEAVDHEISGIVVEPNADSLAGGITWMVNHRDVWNKMSTHAYKKYSELFNGNISVENMVKKYYL